MESTDTSPLKQPVQRDLRIDFFRGLALLMILIDHVENMLGVSLLSSFTLKGFGYCDAAEVFVFLSGYLYGIVYSRVYRQYGSLGCFKKSLHRGFGLYLATLLTLGCCLAISIPFAIENVQISKHLFLFPLLEAPVKSTAYLLNLFYTPYGFEILRFYILLFLFLSPALFWLFKRSVALACLVSFGIYSLSQFFDWSTIPMAYSQFGRFYFNPLSWQLLFFIGLVIGSKNYDKKSVLIYNAFLKYFALLIVLCAFYIDFIEPRLFSSNGIVKSPWFHLLASMQLKQTLGLFRLINFLALAYYVSSITSSMQPFWKSKLAFPLVVCGQHPLIVYCLGLVLLYLNVVLFNELSLGPKWILPFHFIGCGISISVALAVHQYYKLKN
ncbi:OpgC family protein [Gimesia aquarii]|uniref:OpgC protein n=1 Tax=Gimesia aquarii TaxID=2527964 RepID=A0A517VXQ0_9PLAN|nr:OpgC domain-containing protein [Gimesia aquarii]QDT97758.1 OpgC protein [Gimesia aquarii]